jgi:hypothetical protein
MVAVIVDSFAACLSLASFAGCKYAENRPSGVSGGYLRSKEKIPEGGWQYEIGCASRLEKTLPTELAAPMLKGTEERLRMFTAMVNDSNQKPLKTKHSKLQTFTAEPARS